MQMFVPFENMAGYIYGLGGRFPDAVRVDFFRRYSNWAVDSFVTIFELLCLVLNRSWNWK